MSVNVQRHSIARRQEGVALLVTLMVLMLVSALMVGFVTAIIADQRASGLDRDQTQAYAAAHAGLEQLTSDLSGVFTQDFSPDAARIGTLTSTPPALPGFQFIDPDGTSGYRILFTPDGSGNPAPESATGSTISAGPYQGFRGIITPYNITVTARSRGGAEVRMRRTLQTVAVPVFQFGIFSDADLSFHAGATFNFGGRVHTNGNLHLAQGGGTLTLADRVTAVGDVIRTNLSNGTDTLANWNGTVSMIRALPSTFRNLGRTEGSLVTNNPAVQNEPAWTTLSVGTYASNIRNGRTGARRLDLPLVSQGARPIDLVRRPARNSNEDTAQRLIYQQRFYGKATLRILLSDTRDALMQLPTVRTDTEPVFLSGAANPLSPSEKVLDYALTPPDNMRSPIANSEDPLYVGAMPAGIAKDPHNYPLLGGYIKIEMQSQDETWLDVTREILGLGISGRNLADANAGSWNRFPDTTYTTPIPPVTGLGDICAEPHRNAIVRLQRVRDVPAEMAPCGIDTDVSGNITGNVSRVSQNEHDYWPLTLYDPREGYLRDATGLANTDIRFGGVIHYIELDINNLRQWLLTQPDARNDNGNGFIVYFSDRRSNRDGAGQETAEYGFEDFINPLTAAGTPNNTLDAGEDVNGDSTRDVYGTTPVAPPLPWATATPWDNVTSIVGPLATVARANRPIFFRRALKIVNGGLYASSPPAGACTPAPCNNVPAPGLTIASENPVYVQGNFNATTTDTVAEPNVAAAIIADAVTLLSNNWNDIRSFTSPHASSGRAANQTGYRMAVVSGRTIPFTRSLAWTSEPDFGTDGGAHNFLRYIESWNGQSLNYRGSLVSLFNSRQAVGIYKYTGASTAVYQAPTRAYNFDTDFLLPQLLPPGTPMFRDVNTLTFRQLLRPTQ
jgi:hypothetical protein